LADADRLDAFQRKRPAYRRPSCNPSRMQHGRRPASSESSPCCIPCRPTDQTHTGRLSRVGAGDRCRRAGATSRGADRRRSFTSFRRPGVLHSAAYRPGVAAVLHSAACDRQGKRPAGVSGVEFGQDWVQPLVLRC
jgi:hypothetical protein